METNANPYAWAATGDDHEHQAAAGTWSGWHLPLAAGQPGTFAFVCACGETWEVERTSIDGAEEHGE